jgi:branched-chain amino acid transport system substrate-binding protein
MGPYATPNILAAMAIAERNNMVLPQHTSVLAPAMNYECQFPAWSIGPNPNEFIPNLLLDGVATLESPPQKVAIVTVQNGSALFIKEGSPDDPADPGMSSIAEDKGLDVVLDVAYPPGTTDFGSLATQIRDAAPDLLVSLSLGVDTVGQIQALKQLNADVPLIFSLFPAPGPLQGLGADGEGVLSVSIFEPSDKSLAAVGEEGAAIVEEFQTEAAAAQLYPVFETQAAASWNAWEILVAGVEAAGTVDDHQAICDALHESGAQTTFSGQLAFDPEDNNFWPTTLGLKQIQDGEWVMVYPEASAAAPIQGPQN